LSKEKISFNLYHAIPLNDLKTYFEQGGILSRSRLSQENPYFTRFFSDPKDIKLGCWDRAFGNFTDLGARFGNFDNYCPNAFGAITLVLKQDLFNNLQDAKITSVSISQQSYDPQKHDVDIENLSSYFEQKGERFFVKPQYQGLEFSTSDAFVNLDNVGYILVDPIEYKGQRLIDRVGQLVEDFGVGCKVIPRKLKNEDSKKIVLDSLVSWADSLGGTLLHKNQDLESIVPENLKSWLAASPKPGRPILASWLTYTFNGTLLHL